MFKVIMVVLQIFEWQAMIYLILSQKGRKIEEILYDHNTENIHISIKEERLTSKTFHTSFGKAKRKTSVRENNYRRKEI
jgi:hypothetical protein